MGRAVLRLVEEGPAAVATRLQARPTSVEHRGHGDADESPAQAVDAAGPGLELRSFVDEDDGQRRRARDLRQHRQSSRVPLPVAVRCEQGPERLAQLERLPEVAIREPRAGGHEVPLARPGRKGSGIAEPFALVLEIDCVDERLYEPERLGRGFRYVVAWGPSTPAKILYWCSRSTPPRRCADWPFQSGSEFRRVTARPAAFVLAAAGVALAVVRARHGLGRKPRRQGPRSRPGDRGPPARPARRAAGPGSA